MWIPNKLVIRNPSSFFKFVFWLMASSSKVLWTRLRKISNVCQQNVFFQTHLPRGPFLSSTFSRITTAGLHARCILWFSWFSPTHVVWENDVFIIPDSILRILQSMTIFGRQKKKDSTSVFCFQCNWFIWQFRSLRNTPTNNFQIYVLLSYETVGKNIFSVWFAWVGIYDRRDIYSTKIWVRRFLNLYIQYIAPA